MNLSTFFLSAQRMRFWQPCRKLFLGKSHNFSTLCPEKVEKLYICSKIFVFLNVILWTRKLPFWQPRRTFLHKKPKPFRSRSGKIFIFFQKNYLSEKRSGGHVECSFDTPQKKFFWPEAECFLINVR